MKEKLMAWRGFGGFWLLRYPALDRCQSVIVDVFVLRCCDPHKQCAIADCAHPPRGHLPRS